MILIFTESPRQQSSWLEIFPVVQILMKSDGALKMKLMMITAIGLTNITLKPLMGITLLHILG
jgi:hypothetical protein